MTKAIRDEYTKRLLDSYRTYYDFRSPGKDSPASLLQICELSMKEESYILMKKNVLWSAEDHEYSYLFSKKHLTLENYRQMEEYVLQDGLNRIQPGPGHKCSVLSIMVVCETADPEAIRALRKCRIHKNFRFALHGWMDMRTGIAVLEKGKSYTNLSGHDNAKLLNALLDNK